MGERERGSKLRQTRTQMRHEENEWKGRTAENIITPQRNKKVRKREEKRWKNNKLHVLFPQACTVKAGDVIIHT